MTKSVLAGNVLIKPRRSGIRKVRADKLKPPYEIIDEDNGTVRFELVYVRDGTEKRVPCTPEVYTKVQGKKRPGSKKAPPSGLYNRRYCYYDLIFATKGKQVIGIDCVAQNRYPSRESAPIDQADISDVVVAVDLKDGSFDVEAVPPGTDDREVVQILKELDGLEEIRAGEVIGKSEVISISRNKVYLELFGE